MSGNWHENLAWVGGKQGLTCRRTSSSTFRASTAPVSDQITRISPLSTASTSPKLKAAFFPNSLHNLISLNGRAVAPAMLDLVSLPSHCISIVVHCTHVRTLPGCTDCICLHSLLRAKDIISSIPGSEFPTLRTFAQGRGSRWPAGPAHSLRGARS